MTCDAERILLKFIGVVRENRTDATITARASRVTFQILIRPKNVGKKAAEKNETHMPNTILFGFRVVRFRERVAVTLYLLYSI